MSGSKHVPMTYCEIHNSKLHFNFCKCREAVAEAVMLVIYSFVHALVFIPKISALILVERKITQRQRRRRRGRHTAWVGKFPAISLESETAQERKKKQRPEL